MANTSFSLYIKNQYVEKSRYIPGEMAMIFPIN